METVKILISRANASRREHRLEDAERDLVEAVALCRKSESQDDVAHALVALGQVERDLRNLEASRKCYMEAVGHYRGHREKRTFAHTIRHLGDVLQEMDALAEAENCYAEALEIYRSDDATPPLELANAIRSAAVLKDRLVQREQAAGLWAEARDLYAAADVQAGVAECARRMAGENRKTFRL